MHRFALVTLLLLPTVLPAEEPLRRSSRLPETTAWDLESLGKTPEFEWVAFVWRRLLDSETNTVRDRTGTAVGWIGAYLTLNADGMVHFAERYPEGRVELVEVDLAMLGPAGHGNSPDELIALFTSNADDDPGKFTSGDIRVLRLLAYSKFDPGFGDVQLRRRLASTTTEATLAGEVVSRPEGYLVSRVHETVELPDGSKRQELILQPRVGRALSLDNSDPVYEHLGLTTDADLSTAGRAATVLAFLSHTENRGIRFGYVHGSNEGSLVFFVRHSDDNGITRELWTIDASGNLIGPVQVVGEALEHADRSTPYFRQEEKTLQFGNRLAVELTSGTWDRVAIGDFDSGTPRADLLVSLARAHNEVASAEALLERTQRFREDSRTRNPASAETKRLEEDVETAVRSRDEARLRLRDIESSRYLRAALTRDLSKTDWRLSLLFRQHDGHVRRVPSERVLLGPRIAMAYADWRQDGVLRNSPHAMLDDAEARAWFAGELLQPERNWVRRWNSDPVGLLRNIDDVVGE